jgi:radical SAM protein with 4Fe4S-binding SPASM domain
MLDRLNARNLLADALDAFRSTTDAGYRSVMGAVRQEIEATYAKFLFRAPTRQEVAQHVRHFCQRLETFEERSRATRQGTVRKYLRIRPFSVELDITNQCNLRCIMCHFADERVHKTRREDISVEGFSRIAEQLFPLCNLLNLSFGTEPLLHRKFVELLAIVKQYDIPCVYMVTNGLLLNEELIDRILGVNGLHHITISIDAAIRSTYERIRVGGSFDRLIRNIRSIQRVKRERGWDSPSLNFNFVLMRSNVTELPALIRLAHDLGVGHVTAIHMVPFQLGCTDTAEESLVGHKDLCNRALDEARAVAAKYQVGLNVPDNFEDETATSLIGKNNRLVFHLNVPKKDLSTSCCQFPWYWVGIDPYGEINPCGWWFSELPMGNIKTESFEAIWNGERYRALRTEHAGGTLRSTCVACPAGGLGNVNNKNAFLVREPTGPAFLGQR